VVSFRKLELKAIGQLQDARAEGEWSGSETYGLLQKLRAESKYSASET
jgi:hypothetical protein